MRCVCEGGKGKGKGGKVKLGRERRVEQERRGMPKRCTGPVDRQNSVHLCPIQGDLHLSDQGTIKPKVSGLQKDVW